MKTKNYNLPVCFMTVILSSSAMGANGDIVTVPSYQLGLPDSNYLTVNDMVTSGMGSNQDAKNVIKPLQNKMSAVDPKKKNDLMHWYVSTPHEGQTVVCSGNSFRLTFDENEESADKKVAAVMAVWLPAPASEITVSFQSRSEDISLAIYTFDFGDFDNLDDDSDDVVTRYWSHNNLKNYKKDSYVDGVITFNETFVARDISKNGKNCPEIFTGNYLLLMFNTNNSEDEMLDINGIGVSFVPEYPTATIDEFAINPFNDVGNNIMMLPEPTTTTLSLAALCMLAARRRRR